jgi:hypothetical protein
MKDNQIEFLFYQLPDEDIRTRVYLDGDTVWLTQEQMSNLFDKAPSTISEHISNIYATGELIQTGTMTTKFGNSEFNKGQPPKYYNLDMIIAVGYRVNSKRATRFRIWATQILKEYITKGFAMNDEYLKQGKAVFGKDYFKELLERVRSIRASERRIWQQITDIFAECSVDYDAKSSVTKEFYALIQNKFHFAITGQTAAEIVYNTADKNKENMGLTTWKNSPDGRILKSDVSIAKNYLSEKDIRRLERAVTGYFDYIEDLIESESTFTMEQFSKSVNEFIAFRKFKIIEGKGKISHKLAVEKAEAEYEEFNKTQKIISDFDKEVKSITVNASILGG